MLRAGFQWHRLSKTLLLARGESPPSHNQLCPEGQGPWRMLRPTLQGLLGLLWVCGAVTRACHCVFLLSISQPPAVLGSLR